MAKDLTITFFAVWFAAFLCNGLPDVLEGMYLLDAIIQSLGFALFGLVLAFVTFIAKRASAERLRYALIVGILGVALPALGTLIGEDESEKNALFTFQPNGCEFSVAFPSTPTITDKTVGGSANLSFQGAKLAMKDGTALRADCAVIDVVESAKRAGGIESLISTLAKDVAERSGLDPYQVTTFNSQPNGALVEGTKHVAGYRVTYRVKFFIGKSSIFTAYQGAQSSQFPTEEGIKFFESVSEAGHGKKPLAVD